MEHELDFHLNSPPLSARLRQTVQWAWEILREERHTMLVLIWGPGSWDAGKLRQVHSARGRPELPWTKKADDKAQATRVKE